MGLFIDPPANLICIPYLALSANREYNREKIFKITWIELTWIKFKVRIGIHIILEEVIHRLLNIWIDKTLGHLPGFEDVLVCTSL